MGIFVSCCKKKNKKQRKEKKKLNQTIDPSNSEQEITDLTNISDSNFIDDPDNNLPFFNNSNDNSISQKEIGTEIETDEEFEEEFVH
ncbi:hypothetical protein M0813_06891 [Anaeramoeba flamelloides]|uniref:Uncharacterized protein n=1 Tax=Anaeramoeba flamelloides TaxID=1746091 RepID=A0ABQ8XF45_9EUKA|nr:hypothetical protein M0813_06891 [Anaeramoeba flamelloides]